MLQTQAAAYRAMKNVPSLQVNGTRRKSNPPDMNNKVFLMQDVFKVQKQSLLPLKIFTFGIVKAGSRQF